MVTYGRVYGLWPCLHKPLEFPTVPQVAMQRETLSPSTQRRWREWLCERRRQPLSSCCQKAAYTTRTLDWLVIGSHLDRTAKRCHVTRLAHTVRTSPVVNQCKSRDYNKENVSETFFFLSLWFPSSSIIKHNFRRYSRQCRLVHYGCYANYLWDTAHHGYRANLKASQAGVSLALRINSLIADRQIDR